MKAILCTGSTYLTAPRAIACLGMPNMTLVSSFWAMVIPPASKISCIPCAPSLPIPVSRTPIAPSPQYSATDLKVAVTDGRWPSTGALWEHSSLPLLSISRCVPSCGK